MCLKKKSTKETGFSHIAMCINASETPFTSYETYASMCYNYKNGFK